MTLISISSLDMDVALSTLEVINDAIFYLSLTLLIMTNLCSLCKAMFCLGPLPANVITQKHSKHDSFFINHIETSFDLPGPPNEHLEAGSTVGCQLCLLLRSTITNEEWESMSLETRFLLAPSAGRVLSQWMTSYVFREQNPADKFLVESALHYLHMKGTLVQGSSRGRASSYLDKSVSVLLSSGVFPDVMVTQEANSGSQTSMHLARLWLQDCELNHPRCHGSGLNTMRMPTRLIHVPLSALSAPCLREDVPDGTRYVTLSHCWGGTVPTRLLTSNLELFLCQIPLAELPSTFQDALQVTRSIGIEYLWIDSLCIMQDSSEDWAQEAASMYSVYSNAVLNIVATSARNSHEGLFTDRDPRHIRPCRIQLPDDNEDASRSHYHCFNDHLWKSEEDASPVYKRAWCTQELILSSRNLHFGRSQLFWECPTRRACEQYPNGMPTGGEDVQKKFEISLGKTELQRRSIKDSAVSSAAAESRADELWRQVVEKYTRGSLTKGSDKLVAISALARHIHRLFLKDDEYVCGLWKSSLPRGLLWYTSGQTSRPVHYRAPSWSWASIDCSIVHGTRLNYTYGVKTLIKIKEVHMTPSSLDSFGSVIDGHLLLGGRLARIAISSGKEGRRLFLNLDCLIPFEKAAYLHEDVQESSNPHVQHLFVLPILRGSFFYLTKDITHFLLLQSVDESRGIFSRFGMCNIITGEEDCYFEEAFQDCGLWAKQQGYIQDEEDERLFQIKLV